MASDNNNVIQLRKEVESIREVEARLPKGPEPPDNGNMDHRVTALETRLDTILPTLATKGDVGEARVEIQKVGGEIHKWMLATVLTIIGTMLAAIFGVFQIAKTAQPQQQAAAPSVPIIINVPPQQQSTEKQRRSN